MPHPKPQRPTKSPLNRPDAQPDPIDPIWLLKAFAATIGGAALCAYLTFCFLFYQGQWQLVLHPTRSTKPDTLGEMIHFGPDESAVPQLAGLWIPAEPGGRYASITILCLSGGDGSRSDLNPTLQTLHSLGLNVFAFDYRGYGQSAALHPSQQSMTQDATTAWRYLTTSRNLPASQIILYGTGVGASLATQLASDHPGIPTVLLESPRGDLLGQALNDPRSKLVPVHLLFHNRFDLEAPLANLKTPKLFLLVDDSSKISKSAQSPKMIANLRHDDLNGPIYREEITRFLDQYIPQNAPTLNFSPEKQ